MNLTEHLRLRRALGLHTAQGYQIEPSWPSLTLEWENLRRGIAGVGGTEVDNTTTSFYIDGGVGFAALSLLALLPRDLGGNVTPPGAADSLTHHFIPGIYDIQIDYSWSATGSKRLFFIPMPVGKDAVTAPANQDAFPKSGHEQGYLSSMWVNGVTANPTSLRWRKYLPEDWKLAIINLTAIAAAEHLVLQVNVDCSFPLGQGVGY